MPDPLSALPRGRRRARRRGELLRRHPLTRIQAVSAAVVLSLPLLLPVLFTSLLGMLAAAAGSALPRTMPADSLVFDRSGTLIADLHPADCSPQLRGLMEVCLVLFNTNEMAYVD